MQRSTSIKGAVQPCKFKKRDVEEVNICNGCPNSSQRKSFSKGILSISSSSGKTAPLWKVGCIRFSQPSEVQYSTVPACSSNWLKALLQCLPDLSSLNPVVNHCSLVRLSLPVILISVCFQLWIKSTFPFICPHSQATKSTGRKFQLRVWEL